MSNESRNPRQPEDRPYRVYRGESRVQSAADDRSESRARSGADDRSESRARSGADERSESRARSRADERPYTTYRAAPRSLLSRLRGEEESAIPGSGRPADRGPSSDGHGGAGGGRFGGLWPAGGRITPRRVLKYLAIAIVAWLALSLVLFLVSAQIQSGSIPQSAEAALAGGSNMITSTDTVLVIGTDQRPPGSKEPGAFAGGIRSDTIMLWRIGGGVSRRLSIPRDTAASIPGHGTTKINAAYAYGGPALAIKTIEQFTGIKINHLIVVNLANFPKFIDAIGGIDVTTGRICSQISGGVQKGGFTLNLAPGAHHLDGRDALTLARTRENRCNQASNDLTREGYQQKILNAIKSRLLSPSAFFRLPWASWYAPQAVATDMGGPTLLTLFAAAEIGGSAPTQILTPTGTAVLPDGGDALTVTPAAIHRAVAKLMNG
jgi:LCP family protein required for cell wall assembly